MTKKQLKKIQESLNWFTYIIVSENHYKQDNKCKPTFDNFILQEYRNNFLKKSQKDKYPIILSKKPTQNISRNGNIFFRTLSQEKIWIP